MYNIVRDGVFKRIRHYLARPFYRFLCRFTPVYKTVETFRERSHALGFNKGHQDYALYYTLYRLVRTRKPQYVLECGSGCTTSVILCALLENGTGKLISVDEAEYYGRTTEKVANEILKNPPLEMHVLPTEQVPGGVRYQGVPDLPYDLMFVDGPVTTGVDFDVFDQLAKNPTLPVIIDCRHPTVNALRLKYPSTRFNYISNAGFVNL